MSNKLTLGILGAAAVGIIALAVMLIVVVAGGGSDKKDSANGSNTPTASDDSHRVRRCEGRLGRVAAARR